MNGCRTFVDRTATTPIDKSTAFDQPGLFGYVCFVHGAMTGTILVGP